MARWKCHGWFSEVSGEGILDLYVLTSEETVVQAVELRQKEAGNVFGLVPGLLSA
jgi:hypothetical protein